MIGVNGLPGDDLGQGIAMGSQPNNQVTYPVPPPTSEPSALKHDTGKLPLNLIDPDAIEGLAAVLQFGAKKYAAHNWRQGFKYSRLLAAMLRHIFAIMRGQYLDPESGLPHIDHVGCCWMFLSNMMKTRPDLDDLPKNARSTD